MRASRLLSILILLQLRTRLTAAALAAEFEVSIRTIYRDVDALSAAGVPVYGDKGPGGGFQLLDGYRTKLTGLDREEAEAMLLIGLPDQATALGLGHATARARNKLLAALPGAASLTAGRIESRFYLDTVDWYKAARPAPFLVAITRAVLDQHPIRMIYESWTAEREWLVEPLGLILKGGNWYLVAQSAGTSRIFSVADVRQLLPGGGDERFERPPDFDLAGWWRASQLAFEARLRPDTAILRASPLGLKRLRLLGEFAATAVAEASDPDAEGWQKIHLPLEKIESAAPMLLGIGPEIDVIAPPALRAAIGTLAAAVARRMQIVSDDEA